MIHLVQQNHPLYFPSDGDKAREQEEAHEAKCFMPSGHVYELWIPFFKKGKSASNCDGLGKIEKIRWKYSTRVHA